MMKKLFAILIPAFFFSAAIGQWNKLPVVTSPKFRMDLISSLKYGAIPDGNTLNTKSINAAIDAGNKKGGAVVLVPSALWLTGPLVFKSNINLCLAAAIVST